MRNIKILVSYLLFFMIHFIVNYNNVTEYDTNYNVNNFKINKLIEKKYRCIRYYKLGEYNKLMNKTCDIYNHEYTIFKLGEQLLINKIYINNIILSILTIILSILFI